MAYISRCVFSGSGRKIAAAIFLALSLAASTADSALRVGIASFTGDSKYPLVMNGLRQVLTAGMEQTGLFEIAELPGNISAMSVKDMSLGTNAQVALLPSFREDLPTFTIVLRAYDVSTGYNLGSREVRGKYAEIKFVQDRLLISALELLRTAVPEQVRTKITKTHTSRIGAVQALGEADVAVREKRYADAFAGFARSRQLDGEYKAAEFQLQRSAEHFLRRLDNPVDIGRVQAVMGNGEAAMVEFNRALLQDPRNVGALIGKAELLLGQGKHRDALDLFRSASQIDGRSAEAVVGTARCYKEMGNEAEALAALERARALGAAQAEVYETLGDLYVARNRRQEASEAFLTAGILSEKAVDFGQARKAYARVNRISPSAATLEREAEAYLNEGEIQTSINLLTRALLLDPQRDSILAKLGYAYYLLGNYALASSRLNRAFELNQNNYEANLYLGLILMEDRTQLERAAGHLENAARIKPGATKTQFYLAQIYIRLNRAQAAVAVLQKLAKSNPRDPAVHKELGDAYAAADDVSGAAAAYSQATRLNPDFMEAYEALAVLYLRRRMVDEAIETVRQIFAIDAQDNLFVREGYRLLEGVVPNDLLALIREFPKMVAAAAGMMPLNQVAVARLVPDTYRTPRGFFDKYLNLYVFDDRLLRRDIELAMFSKYRVVPAKSLPGLAGDNVTESDFEAGGPALEHKLNEAKIDGLFSFHVLDYSVFGDRTEVRPDISLFTNIERARFQVEDKSNLPRLSYPTDAVLRFNTAAPFAYVLLIFFGIGPLVYVTVYRARARGWGNLQVVINYDPRHESFLTLKLTKSLEKERDPRLVILRDRDKDRRKRYKQLLKQKGAWVRKMVGKNTLFERVPAREYYCYLYGTVEDSALRQTVGNYYMVQRVRVEKNQTRELVFQIEKDEAFVTIFVFKGQDEVTGAELRAEGQKEAKYSRAGTGAFFYFKPGSHKLTVRQGDRTVTRVIDVRNLEDQMIHVDLQTADEAFESVAGGRDLTEVAAEFERDGRLEEAADIYERTGHSGLAGETRAKALAAEGNIEEAAAELVKSREFLRAAEIYREMGNVEKADYLTGLHCFAEGEYEKALRYLEPSENHAVLAKVHEKLGDTKNAAMSSARVYLSKGQKVEAAQTFLKAGAFAEAAEIFEALGDFSKAAVLHAKDENYPLAAELFARSGDPKKAAMAFEKGGHLDQAIELYRGLGEIDKVVELLTRDERYVEAAAIYQKQGLTDEAIAVCQRVPSFHNDYPRTQVLLANLFADKGLNDMAVKTFREALSSMPGGDLDIDSSYTYGVLLEKTGDLQGALERFENVLKRDFHYKDAGIKVNEIKSGLDSAKKAQSLPASLSSTIAGEAPAPDDRYELIDELGRGAMGIVYKAKDKTLDRIVALKTLPHTLKNDTEAFTNLMREAQTAARLNHPNIVTVYDVGRQGDTYYIAMEFAQGKTLDLVLKQVKAVNLANFLHIAKALCDVVGYAHRNKVIHRDIKPSNIILMSNRTVKLMDFGLARILQDMAIDKTMLRGTPLYMSPEQILGKDIDHRTDLYSMGILFFEMLSGRPPFTDGDIMYAHLHAAPPDLKSLAPSVPPHVVSTVMACLAKDKNGRPPTAEALLAALLPSNA